MHELRHDPFQRRWVIIASERTRRPLDLHERGCGAPVPAEHCPFCPGNEAMTTPPIRTLTEAGDWQLRVVPNRYPALRIEGELEREGVGLFDRMSAVGAHEVVIETPQHELGMADMSTVQLDRILEVYRERLVDLYRDPRLRYVLIFKNHGVPAGASQSHSHSQIIATPVTPRTIVTELQVAREHYQLKERCLYCDVIRDELRSGERVVQADSAFVVLAPYASRFPFELMILPREHGCRFETITPEQRGALARVLRDSLKRLSLCLDDPPYNVMLHTAPNLRRLENNPEPDWFHTLQVDYHWHIEIIPRLTRIAGFEWGTGFYINPTAPETAARFLRKADPYAEPE